MSIPVDEFLVRLHATGLITEQARHDLTASLSQPDAPRDAEQLIGQLVESGTLTLYQARAVANGQERSLVLGNYLILDQLGAGGMGTVFKALCRSMDRIVALKFPSRDIVQSPELLQRFQRESRLVARLSHPNIVNALDADESDGSHFFVMEYVEGQDLAAKVKQQGPLPVAEAIDCILQAARGLQYAHEQGVIHRDIKPANLLLDTQGTAKILDLGLARSDWTDDTRTELTATGDVMGTVDYMAPEQALGTHAADARSDIYSLGATLWFLLTGRPLYEADSVPAILLAHSEEPVPALRMVRPDVPRGVERVFRRMVAKQPQERHQTAADVVTDLARHRPGTTVPGPERGGRDGTRNNRPALYLGMGSVGGVLLLGTIIITIANQDNAGTIVTPADARTGIGQLQPRGTGTPENPPRGTPSDRAASPPLAVAPFDAEQAKHHQRAWAEHLGMPVESVNSIGIKLNLIPPGEFLMGSSDAEIAREAEVSEADHGYMDRLQYLNSINAEQPQHRVIITRPFLMGTTEVTVGQFRRFVEATMYVTEAEQYGFGNSHRTTHDNPTEIQKRQSWRTPLRRGGVSDDHPVMQVTWNDAVAFCEWLSKQENATYRLPTEAEWEYACRSGTTTRYSFGDDALLLDQFGVNGRGGPLPVGLRRPNAFGLLDMHGNVWELCADWFEKDYYERSPLEDPPGPAAGSARVFRGGCWGFTASLCRSAFRESIHPSSRYDLLGFRIIRILSDDPGFRLAAVSSSPSPAAPLEGRPADVPPSPAATPANSPPVAPWQPTSEQQTFLDEVARLPVEEHAAAVARKLQEINPGFDGLDLREHLRSSFGVFHGDGPLHAIRIRFAPAVTRYVQEHHWHETQTLTPQDDGGLILEMQLSQLEEVKSWILSFGANAEVEEPAELRELITQDLTTLAARYGNRRRAKR